MTPHDPMTDYTADDLRRRAAAALGEVRVCPGEAAINENYVAHDPASLRAAAVLVPVIDRAPGATVLLTVRTTHLPAHAAEIAFPGGKIEPSDTSPVEAALRETQEEIGLDRSNIEIIGRLDSWRTGTGYQIEPVLAIVRPPLSLTLDPFEVVETFETPLRFLMSGDNYATEAREWRGTKRIFHTIPFGDRYIWGATAGILRHMRERLYG